MRLGLGILGLGILGLRQTRVRARARLRVLKTGSSCFARAA